MLPESSQNSYKIIIINEIKKFINEFIVDSNNEGVADVYANKNFNIPNQPKDDEEMVDKYIKSNEIDNNIYSIVVNNQRYLIYKNPQSLKNFLPDIRGVLTINGDIYLVNSSKLLHGDLINGLVKIGILNSDDAKDWNIKIPTSFIGIVRLMNSNYFSIARSYNKNIIDDKNNYLKFYSIGNKKFSNLLKFM